METRPPKIIGHLVRVLVPPASREHVLGDLNERYVSARRYLVDALRVLPFVVASRVRRTTHPLGALLVGLFLWWAVFWGNRQQSWMTASIPTLLTLLVLALRDAYRGKPRTWLRATVVDITAAALVVLLSQAILSIVAPALLLTSDTLLIGFPYGFAVLFLLRWQSPSGFHQPPGFARTLSLAQLRTEIGIYQSVVGRAVRIEIGACLFIAAVPSLSLWNATAYGKIGGGLTAAGAMFVAWFLYRHARVRSIPEDIGFQETIDAYRADLAHRRRLSLSYGWWYLAPLAVGPAVGFIGPQLHRPGSLRAVLLTVLVCVAIGAVLVIVQRGLAAKTQLRIDQLATVTENT